MSGIMQMALARGASAFAFTISSNQTNANLATLATAAGWNGSSALTATINSGVYISSNSTGTPALTVSGSFPGGVKLINNGFIYGMGGAGGGGGSMGGTGGTGSTGGLALSVSSAITIDNTNGVIGGGGGGGGGGGAYSTAGGGGGGGGISSYAANSAGGPYVQYGNSYSTAGGAGTYTAAGGGGGGIYFNFGYCYCTGRISYYLGGTGGTGGSRGSSGSNGGSGSSSYGGGASGGSGGSGGGAVSGNSNITWTATGSRFGSIT